jgi:hypothetical protein
MLTRLTGLVVSTYSHSFFNEIGNTIKTELVIGDKVIPLFLQRLKPCVA